MAADNVALGVALKAEAAKVAPLGASLVLWGMTLQEWTILFGCLYAAGLFLDLVVRRWLIPLVQHLRQQGKRPTAEDQP